MEGVKLAAAMNFKFPTMVPTSLHSIVTNASHDGIQLMADFLAWDPHKRPTAAQVQLLNLKFLLDPPPHEHNKANIRNHVKF